MLPVSNSNMTITSAHAHVNALILLPVVNLSLKIDSATSISYTTWKVLSFDAAFRVFWRFFTAHAQFRLYY